MARFSRFLCAFALVFGFLAVFSLGAAADSTGTSIAHEISFADENGSTRVCTVGSVSPPTGWTSGDPASVAGSDFSEPIVLLQNGNVYFKVVWDFFVDSEPYDQYGFTYYYKNAEFPAFADLDVWLLTLTDSYGTILKFQLADKVNSESDIPAEVPAPTNESYTSVFYLLPDGTCVVPEFEYHGSDFTVGTVKLERSFFSPMGIYGSDQSCTTTYYELSSGIKTYGAGSMSVYYDIEDPPSDSVLDAILDQTEDMNNNHDETMGKLDDMTSFDDEEQSSMTGDLDGQQQVFEEKLGILSFADQLIEQLLGLFEEDTSGRGLVFPAFNLSVGGESYSVWQQQVFDLSNLDTWVGDLMTVVRFATSFLVWAALVAYIQKIFSALVEDWSDR